MHTIVKEDGMFLTAWWSISKPRRQWYGTDLPKPGPGADPYFSSLLEDNIAPCWIRCELCRSSKRIAYGEIPAPRCFHCKAEGYRDLEQWPGQEEV